MTTQHLTPVRNWDRYGSREAGAQGSDTVVSLRGRGPSEIAVATAGAGGDGARGVKGGGGGDARADAVANGRSDTLTASAEADGGAGGDGGKNADGGDGGTASLAYSELFYDDTSHGAPSAVLGFRVVAGGGGGGAQLGEVGRGATGGDGTALGTFTGAEGSSLTGSVIAYGGNGGAGSKQGHGGNAEAVAHASGDRIVLHSVANAGSGNDSGLATALADAQGSEGEISAKVTAQSSGALALVSGEVTSTLAGHSIVAAAARMGGPAPAASSSAGATIEAQGDPSAARLSAIYDHNSMLQKGFGHDAEAEAVGVVENRHSGGAGLETITSEFQIRVHVGELDAMGETVLGLFGGHALGAGFDGLSFSVVVGNEDDFLYPVEEVTLADEHFTDASSADRYFSNHTIDFGNLLDETNAVGELVVTVSLTTTGAAPGGGYGAGFLLGDVGDTPAAPIFAHETRLDERAIRLCDQPMEPFHANAAHYPLQWAAHDLPIA